MARLVYSIEKGGDSDSVTEGSSASSADLAVDLDLAAALTDREFEEMLEKIKMYRRKHLSTFTTA